ncbi:MAG: monovalent cation/H+ antiporter complex subunit F [Clostridia bacterium]
MSVELATENLFTIALIILAILIVFAFIRILKGPRITDRIVAVNIIGTITMVIIAFLGVMMGEEYLIDICLIYAMVSFLGVVVLTKVYMGAHAANKMAETEAKMKKAKELAKAKENNNGVD